MPATLGQIESVRDFFASASVSVVTDLPFVALYVAMSFVIGGPLGWVLVLAIPLMLGLSWAMQGPLRRAVRTNMTELADLNGTLVEALEGLEDLKTSGAEGRFVHRYETGIAITAESGMRSRAWAQPELEHHNEHAAGDHAGDAGLGRVSDPRWRGQFGRADRCRDVCRARYCTAEQRPSAWPHGYQGARAAMVALNDLMARPTEREAHRNYVPLPRLSGSVGPA